MFIGILGHANGLDEAAIIKQCYGFAGEFEKTFQSLSCSSLRPEGFKPGNPLHLCEVLTMKAILFAYQYIRNFN